MITITKVEVQKRLTDRVNVYVDGEFYSGMSMDVCVKYGIKQGVQMPMEKLEEILLDSEKNIALNKTAKYMQSAMKTTKQIREYLKKKDYGKPVIDYVISKLEEYRYLDDTAYAKAYLDSYGKKIGKLKIRANLKTKGISENIINELLDDYQSNEDDILLLALKKLGKKEPTYENLSKIMVFLASRGYDYDEIKHTLNRIKEQDHESWDWYSASK